MNDWKPDGLLKALLFWITYLLVFSWLPLVRLIMDGPGRRSIHAPGRAAGVGFIPCVTVR